MNADTQAFIDAVNEAELTVVDDKFVSVLADLVGSGTARMKVGGRTFLLKLEAMQERES